MSERYQERIYKSEIEIAYDDTYSKIREMIQNSFLYSNYQEHNLAVDLKAMLYVVSDFIAYNSDSRNIIENDLLPHANFYYDFKSRVEFYGSIINKSIKVRGDCMIDLPSSITDNPLTRCVIAFCDILKNPALLHEYTSAPLLILGFDKEIYFVEKIVMPMIDIILEYMANIMKICGITETAPKKVIKPITSTVDDGKDDTLRIVLAILGGAAIIVSAILYLIWGI